MGFGLFTNINLDCTDRIGKIVTGTRLRKGHMCSSNDSRRSDGVLGAFDRLPSNIAFVDKTGLIVLVNESWRKFATLNGALPEYVCEGVNYLDLCRSVTGPDQRE